MTKNKTRKMSKSTFAIIIMGIAMVAMLAFGGTFAYFTASSVSNGGSSITTGRIQVRAGSFVQTSATNIDKLLPGESTEVTVEVTNDSNRDSYIFLILSEIQCDNGEVASALVAEIVSVKKGTGSDLKGSETITDVSGYWEAPALTTDTTPEVYTVTISISLNKDLGSGEEYVNQEANATFTLMTEQIQKDAVNNATAAAAWANLHPTQTIEP